MTSDDAPPVQRVQFATENLDEATEVLRAGYGEHVPSAVGSLDGFTFEVDSATLSTPVGEFRVERVHHSLHAVARVEPVSAVSVIAPTTGRIRFTRGREQTGDGPLLCPSWDRFTSEWENIDENVGTLDTDGVRRIGAELTGIDPAAIAFTGMSPISPALGRHVAATLTHLQRDVLGSDELLAGPLTRGAVFRTLACALLTAFPNTTYTLDPARDPVHAEPATVRRAVAFIDANSHRDIGLTDIAEAARLGVRGLQMAFRRHRDTTPLAYLKRVRMERAHRNLQAADPTGEDTVTVIAARWGFTHLGAFSRDYRRVYGCPPSHTLRG